MQILEKPHAQTSFPAAVMLAAIPIMRQMSQGRYCVTDTGREVFAKRKVSACSKMCR